MQEETFFANPEEKQIEEFIASDSEVMYPYYDLMDSNLEVNQLKTELQKIIKKDPPIL